MTFGFRAGMKGYALLERGKKVEGGECGQCQSYVSTTLTLRHTRISMKMK